MKSGDIDAENAKVIVEKINEIDDKIINRTDPIAAFMPVLQERKKLLNEVNSLKMSLDTKRGEQSSAYSKLSAERGTTQLFLNRKGIKQDDLSYDGLKKTLDELEKSGRLSSDELEQFRTMTEKVRVAEVDLETATKDVTNAESKLAEKQNQADNFNFFKDAFEKGVANAGGSEANYVLQQAQELPQLIEAIGLHDTEFGKGVEEFVSGTSHFASAVQKLGSGDFVGAITDTILGFQDYGHLIERIGGFSFNGSNEDETVKTINRLVQSNQDLRIGIDRLKDEIANGTFVDAIEAYERAVSKQRDINNNTLEIAKKQAGYHSAHHSFNYYWRGFGESEKNRLAGLMDKESWNGDLFNLTPEEMNKLLSDESVRSKIRNTGKGSYGQAVLDALDEYADLANELDNLTNSIYEKLIGISFDSMYNSFVDKLMDMDAKAKDFSNDFEGYIRQGLYQAMSDEYIKPELQKWYKAFGELTKAKKGNLTQTDIDMLLHKGGSIKYTDELGREQNLEFKSKDEIVNDSLSNRELIEQLGLYNGKNSEQQSSTFNSAQNITYEQADSIAGSLINQSILTEQGNQHLTMLNAKAEEIISWTVKNYDIASDSRDILACMAIHVEEIRDGVVDTIVPKIKSIDSEITRMRKVLEEQ